MSSLYNFSYQISLQNTDAAGVVFFSEYYSIIHLAYESFLRENKISISNLIQNKIGLPIQESNCIYLKPIYLDNNILITIQCIERTDYYFILEYIWYLDVNKTKIGAKLKTKHYCIDLSSYTKIVLPHHVDLVLKKIEVEL